MARKGNWEPGSPEILDRGGTGMIHGVNQPKAQPAGVQARGQGVYTQRTGCLAWLLGGALVLLALVTMGAAQYVEPPADQCCPLCGVLWSQHDYSCTHDDYNSDVPEMDPDSDYWGDANWPQYEPQEGKLIVGPSVFRQ